MDQSAQAVAIGRPPRDQLDTVLTILMWVLLVAVIISGSYLGWMVYQSRTDAALSVPAQRIISAMKDNVRAFPNSAALRVRLGEAYGAAGLTNQAVEQFNAALKIEPNRVGALADLGLVAMKTGDLKAAQGYFQKVIDLTAQAAATSSQTIPDRENAYFNLGQIAVMNRQFDTAVGYLKEALRENRTASDSYFYLAMAYNGLGQPDAALEQLKYALLFDPKYAQANYEAGMIYLSRKDYVDAANHLKAALDNAPKAQPAIDAYTSLGTSQEWVKKSQTASAAGNVTAAIDDAKVAFILAPKDKQTAIFLARLLASNGKGKDALAVWKSVLVLDPNDTVAKAAVVKLSAKPAKKR